MPKPPLRALAALLTFGLAAPAHAELDDFALGDGHDGALAVSTAGQAVNTYAPLAAAAAPGDTQLQVGTPIVPKAGKGFKAGDLVLVIESTGYAPVPDAGDQTPIDLSSDPMGRWELARLASAAGGTLGLTHPLVNAFAAGASQVILVPEYTTVDVAAGGSLTGAAWNGTAGGFVAFLAQGAVTVDGAIDASGLGGQGGVAVNAYKGTDYYGCTQLDEAAGTTPVGEWAEKGEGIAGTAYGDLAMGNVANGAGGGDCDNSGGGGGANAGAGGQGGQTWENTNQTTPNGDDGRPVGGLGGAPLVYSLLDHATFGGGGGAGQENNDVGTSGAAGGGVIFIRGGQLLGAGTIAADGASVTAIAGNDGAGGGGGGGSLYLRFTGAAVCGGVSAQGGQGGSIKYTAGVDHGPGGGGGGGRILLQATDSSSCAANVAAGLSGLFDGTDAWGAGPTPATQAQLVGTIETPPVGGFPVPTITSPTDGSTVTTTQPTITGTAAPGSTVDVYVDGVLVGTATADASGNWSFTPTTPLSGGSHTVQAGDAGQDSYSTPVTFTVNPGAGSTGGSSGSTSAGGSSGGTSAGGGSGSTSAGGSSGGNTSTGGTSAGSASAGGTSAGSASAGGTSAGSASAGSNGGGSATAGNSSGRETGGSTAGATAGSNGGESGGATSAGSSGAVNGGSGASPTTGAGESLLGKSAGCSTGGGGAGTFLLTALASLLAGRRRRS
ncbi:MAG: adventurous gliding motility protein AgmC [Myxococcales bacterium]